MKRKSGFWVLSVFATSFLCGALGVSAAERTYTVACPGIALISPNVGGAQARHQSAIHGFLRDMLLDNPRFRFMTDERAGAIFTQIKSGALDYGTENLCEIFRRHYLPADIVVNCEVLPGLTKFVTHLRIMCHSEAAGVRSRELTCTTGAMMSVDVFPQIAAWVIEAAPDLDAETAGRFRKFAADRAKWGGYFYIAQVCRNEPSTCSGGAQRYGWLLEAQRLAGGNDPVLSAGFADAACLAAHSRFAPRAPLTRGKIAGVAANALNFALGGPDEERLCAFVCDGCCPPRTIDELRGFMREIAADADGRLMETELNDQSEETAAEFGAELVEAVAAPKLPQERIEARGRGAVRLMALRRDKGALAEFGRIASTKSPASRRAVAAALGSYFRKGEKTPPAAAAILKRLAKDEDPAVAVAAIESQHIFGIRNPAAAACARRLLDARRVTEGVIGLPAESQALAVLAREGDASDEGRIRRRLASGCVPVRREAVRALIAKCPFVETDFAVFADPDHTVCLAALSAIPPERLVKDKTLAAAVTKATADFCNPVGNLAAARLAEATKKSGVKTDPGLETLAISHPYFRRKLLYSLEGDKSAKATELIVRATENAHAQTRALAMRILSHRDAAKGRAAALARIGDQHTWVRCRAAEVLSRLARPDDAAAIRARLAKERNRVAKLYLADALARAEGRPAPTPPPAVNSILDGECRNWHCFISDQCDKSSFNAYYTCDMPRSPTPQIRYAHDVLKKPIFPRPRPTGNPLLILTDTSVTDDFWTELDREMPDDILSCVDGVVYGEETMSLDPSDEAGWTSGWQIFCTEAGIDPFRVGGRKENLTENERLAWYDWAEKTGVEGFNELYDFTHFYFGKLRPGLRVCTFCARYAECISRWQSKWKCDVQGSYIYSGDVRYMYAAIRWLHTVWPDRPILWLSGGHVSGDDWNGAATWRSYFAPHPLCFRWDNPYAGNLAAYLAGAETGYFSHYGLENPDKDAGRGGNAGFCAEQIWPPTDPAVSNLTKNIHFGLNKVDRYIRDEMNKAKRAAADPNDLESDAVDGEDITLEEVGGKNDPAVVALAKLKERVFWGLIYEHKFLQDTSRALIGLRRRNPKNAPALMMGSVLGHRPGLSEAVESPFGCWFEDFDVQHNFEMAAHHPQFPKYRFIALGWAHQEYMNEETRLIWNRWIAETPGMLVVNGWMDAGVKMAQRSADCVDGDLRTPWPWFGDIEYVPCVPGDKDNGRPEKPAFYRVENASRCTVLERDARGEAVRVMWRHPQMKAAVVFDLLKGKAKSKEARELMAKFFAGNKVEMPLAEIDRRLWCDENGLRVEVRGWNCTRTNRYEGCELVTGQWNPVVSAELNAAMVTEEYTAPYVAVHGGVCLLSQTKLEILERTPHGFKVKPGGLLRITTKSGRPAKIATASGKPPPPFAGNVEHWYADGSREEGVATLPAIRVDPKAPVWHFSGGAYDAKMKTIADREDAIPPYLLLRSGEKWVVIEDK